MDYAAFKAEIGATGSDVTNVLTGLTTEGSTFGDDYNVPFPTTVADNNAPTLAEPAAKATGDIPGMTFTADEYGAPGNNVRIVVALDESIAGTGIEEVSVREDSAGVMIISVTVREDGATRAQLKTAIDDHSAASELVDVEIVSQPDDPVFNNVADPTAPTTHDFQLAGGASPNGHAETGGKQGREYEFTIPEAAFEDVDTGDTLTISVEGLPPGLTFDPATGTISGTPTEIGTYIVKVTATDRAGESISYTHAIEIGEDIDATLPENMAGSATAIEIYQVVEEANGATLTYSITGAVDQNDADVTGFAINAATGEITYAGAGFDAESVTRVTLTVEVSFSTGGDAVVREVVVKIGDVNELPVAFDTASETTGTLDENVDAGAEGDEVAVATVLAADGDRDAVVTYAIKSAIISDGSNTDIKDDFEVLADGTVRYKGGALDREQLGDGQVVVTVTASSSDGSADVDTVVTVSITDVDEASPSLAVVEDAQSARIDAGVPPPDALDTGQTFRLSDFDIAPGTPSFNIDSSLDSAGDRTDADNFDVVAVSGTLNQYKLVVKAGKNISAFGPRTLTIKANNGKDSNTVTVVLFVNAIPTITVSGTEADALALTQGEATDAPQDTGFDVVGADADDDVDPAGGSFPKFVFKDGDGNDISTKFSTDASGNVSVAAGTVFAADGANVINVEYIDNEGSTSEAGTFTLNVDAVYFTAADLSGYVRWEGGADNNEFNRANAGEAQLIVATDAHETEIFASDHGDIVAGGRGDDVITLGDGDDVVIYRFASDHPQSWRAVDGADTIKNFDRENDKILFVDTDDAPVTTLSGFLSGAGFLQGAGTIGGIVAVDLLSADLAVSFYGVRIIFGTGEITAGGVRQSGTELIIEFKEAIFGYVDTLFDKNNLRDDFESIVGAGETNRDEDTNLLKDLSKLAQILDAGHSYDTAAGDFDAIDVVDDDFLGFSLDIA